MAVDGELEKGDHHGDSNERTVSRWEGNMSSKQAKVRKYVVFIISVTPKHQPAVDMSHEKSKRK